MYTNVHVNITHVHVDITPKVLILIGAGSVILVREKNLLLLYHFICVYAMLTTLRQQQLATGSLSSSAQHDT